MEPLVAIIILNWNGWPDTLECLESLYQIKYSNFQIILVDNDSQDDSIKKIKEYCQGQISIESPFLTYQTENKPIEINELTKNETEQSIGKKNQEEAINPYLTLIKNDANYGFAQGNNIAIKYVLKNMDPNYVLMLNNDTVVKPDFLTQLVNAGEKSAKIGILGPLIYYYDWEGKSDVIANLGGKVDITKYPGYYDLIEVNNLEDFDERIIECDWVSGAALLMKSELPLNYLNEKLFFGCEDIDLALVLKEYGFKSAVVLDSHIWHKEGVSRRKRSSDAIRRALMEIKSNLTFLKAHNNHYYWYLPLYFLQIVKLYLTVLLKGS